MPDVVPPRSAGDRCPGALRVHEAADGGLIRVRLPGGQLDPAQLRTVADCAAEYGDGTLELTSRANLQIRGIPPGGAAARLADRLAGAGLLPTATHERVRNILASPLSGRDGAGRPDIRELVRALDRAVRAEPALAALSGRFLFALDDGRGDVAGLGADLCWRADTGALLLAGRDHGLRMPIVRAVPGLVAAAHGFLRLRATEPEPAAVWRVTDLSGGPARLAETLAAASADRPAGALAAPAGRVPEITDDPAPAPGAVAAPYGRLCVVAGARLGRLRADQARLLAEISAEVEGGSLVVTPWRSVVADAGPQPVMGLLARMDAAGLIVETASPWAGVSACAGRPGCARSLADVRADAASAVAAAGPVPDGREPTGGESFGGSAAGRRLRMHWAGCERRCGLPAGPVAVAVATGDGYAVTAPGGPPPPGPLAERVAQARTPR
ncbi:precorrin-3B synthase [Solwaraspora sp. WMMD1047]|uniref:precorrin-3B synthase n=1 Tax=Solwaraspora sp. WMMD1047 TaxID=3016102 RepID=UPI0024176FF1|nr:precorrin-3B synthase [Solwaraspora sp. WMMD1047]MDG4832834.1 precorrin-3B synthase [Solwaraspora sp. WMMD1047]